MTIVQTATGPAKTMVLNMGPQHPSTHGVLRVLLELDGETVVKADVDIGYLHTGIEKTAESLTYSQTITITDRMDYLAPLSNNLVYCLAVEKLLGLEIPKRAQYILAPCPYFSTVSGSASNYSASSRWSAASA